MEKVWLITVNQKAVFPCVSKVLVLLGIPWEVVRLWRIDPVTTGFDSTFVDEMKIVVVLVLDALKTPL